MYRKFLVNKVKGSNNTIDAYIQTLCNLNVLKKVKPGKYQIIRHVPKKLTLSNARKIAYDKSWKSWFIPLEERLNDDRRTSKYSKEKNK